MPEASAAAQYVRMSTDHQRYSTGNQITAIAEYAKAHGLQVVRTYADEARSGLTIRRRLALQQLLTDVASGSTEFSTILVYDISRWGRFEDPDEAAHYEFLCRRAGIHVVYVAEPFPNDLTMSATLLKALKRAMAHEYSRELAVKVAAGKRNLAARGYWQGGSPGFGYRRVLIGSDGARRGVLQRHERKALHTERTALVLGPDDEVRTVQWMFHAYADDGLTSPKIAAELNARGVRTTRGKRWTGGAVRDLLHNEKYAGSYIYGRTAAPMKSRAQPMPREAWLRVDTAIPGIVDRAVLDRAKARFRKHALGMPEIELLDHLRAIATAEGELSEAAIRRSVGHPSYTTFAKKFGTLGEAFARLGQPMRRPMTSLERSRRIRGIRKDMQRELAQAAMHYGTTLKAFGRDGSMRSDDGVIVRVVALQCWPLRSGESYWHYRPHNPPKADLLALACLNAENDAIERLIMVPSDIVPRICHIAEFNGLWLDAFRVASIDDIARRFERRPLAVPP